MENIKPTINLETNKVITNAESSLLGKSELDTIEKKDANVVAKTDSDSIDKQKLSNSTKSQLTPDTKVEIPTRPKKSVKPPKIEDKPFEEFISKHFIPVLKSSIEEKGTSVIDIKLMQGNRPVVGGTCWFVYCEISEQRRFWLCFNKDLITSDKTILLAESNSAPSIVESFLIDEKKTTLPLLISRVLQRLNGQKWLSSN